MRINPRKIESNRIKSAQYCTSRHNAASIGMELAPNGKTLRCVPLRYIVQMYRSCVQGAFQHYSVVKAEASYLQQGRDRDEDDKDTTVVTTFIYLLLLLLVQQYVVLLCHGSYCFFAVQTKKGGATAVADPTKAGKETSVVVCVRSYHGLLATYAQPIDDAVVINDPGMIFV